MPKDPEISEIEGDAILFSKFGDSPDISLICKQVKKMLVKFQRDINSLKLSNSAGDLIAIDFNYCICKRSWCFLRQIVAYPSGNNFM
jgi:hypothetical protein